MKKLFEKIPVGLQLAYIRRRKTTIRALRQIDHFDLLPREARIKMINTEEKRLALDDFIKDKDPKE